jgi:hypothetical protein
MHRRRTARTPGNSMLGGVRVDLPWPPGTAVARLTWRIVRQSEGCSIEHKHRTVAAVMMTYSWMTTPLLGMVAPVPFSRSRS